MTTIPVYVQALVEVVELPQITVTPSQFGFFQPLSIPPKQTKANVGPPWVLGTPPLITVTPSKWDFYQQLSAPPAIVRPNVGPATVFGYPPPPPAWGWYSPLSSALPPGTKANIGPAWFGISQPVATGTVTPSNWDFYQALSTPPAITKVVPAFNLLSPYVPAPAPEPEVVPTGGHWLPPTRKEAERIAREIAAAERKREELWAEQLRARQELHKQIMDALHPERVIGVSLPDVSHEAISADDEDEDEDDTDLLLLNI